MHASETKMGAALAKAFNCLLDMTAHTITLCKLIAVHACPPGMNAWWCCQQVTRGTHAIQIQMGAAVVNAFTCLLDTAVHTYPCNLLLPLTVDLLHWQQQGVVAGGSSSRVCAGSAAFWSLRATQGAEYR
jgi:hypothetical protein